MIYKSQDDEPDDADQVSQTSQEIKAGLSWLRKRFPGIQSRINVDEDHDEALLVMKQAFSATHVKLFRVERDDITTADRVVAIYLYVHTTMPQDMQRLNPPLSTISYKKIARRSASNSRNFVSYL